MSGKQLPNSGKHSFRPGNVAEREIFPQSAGVEFRLQLGIGKNSLNLGAK